MSYYVVDEDFPSKAQLRAALLMAFLTGVMGFLVSYGLFVKNNKEIQVSSVDRKAAEGYRKRARRARSRKREVQPATGRFTYVAYTPLKKERPKFRRLTDEHPEQTIVAATTRTKPQFGDTEAAGVASSLKKNKKRPSQRVRPTQPKKKEPELDPRALRYPEVEQRPAVVGPAAAWRASQGGLGKI